MIKIPKIKCKNQTAAGVNLFFENFNERWGRLAVIFGTQTRLNRKRYSGRGRPRKMDYDFYIRATRKQVEDFNGLRALNSMK